MNSVKYNETVHHEIMKHKIQDHNETWEAFQNFTQERNLSYGTIKGYESALNMFCQFRGTPDLKEFINQCHYEEDQRVPDRDKTLKRTLLDYRGFLLSNAQLSSNTLKTYFSKVLSFLRHHDVTIPDLPLFKLAKEQEVSYYDIPSKEHIRDALELCDVHMKALILFMSSSGTAKAETLSLTIGDYVKGCEDYYPARMVDLEEILEYLKEKSEVIPVIHLRRIKTDKYYYAVSSPEAHRVIVDSLLYRVKYSDVDFDSPLFDIEDSTLISRFQKINDTLGWGSIGRYRFFRTHTLRKFHASNIGLSADMVDALEGRSKNSIHETYIKVNPDELRSVYREVMHRVMVYCDESYRWNSVPPKLSTAYSKDGESATITLKFNMGADEVGKCMNFINATFYK